MIPASTKPNTQFKQNPASIYLLSGDDQLLVDEAKQNIYQTAAHHEFKHREVLHIENNAAVWQEFLSLAYNLSLFAEKQIIELRFAQAKPGNTGSKLLIEYTQNPPTDNILLLVMPKLDATAKKSQWFKALEQKAKVLQIWPLEHKQLPSWIANKAKQLGLNIDYNCTKILAEHTLGNLLATKQELEKLVLLHGSAYIDEEQLLSSLNDNSRFSSFDLIDAIYAEKNLIQIINILEHLKAEDEEPTLVLWAITREIRLLINCKKAENDPLLLNKHLTSGNYRLKNERKIQIKQFINKIPLQRLEKILCLAGDIDQMIKGIKNDNVWLNLQRLMFQL